VIAFPREVICGGRQKRKEQTMLKINKKVHISGESVVGEKTICAFSAIIDFEKPEKLLINQFQKDKEAYKEHRAECRADYAEFEDTVYAIQADIIKRLGK
jgi:hypothetical protein